MSQLIAGGKEVVALVRSNEAAADLKGLGAETVIGDAFTYKVGIWCQWGWEALPACAPVGLLTPPSGCAVHGGGGGCGGRARTLKTQ